MLEVVVVQAVGAGSTGSNPQEVQEVVQEQQVQLQESPVARGGGGGGGSWYSRWLQEMVEQVAVAGDGGGTNTRIRNFSRSD